MIKREYTLFNDEKRNSMYYTVLNDMLYYSRREKRLDRFFIEGKEILKNSCAAHNFTPFMLDGQVCAIGGMDDWKSDVKWRGIDYDTFKKTFEEHFKKEYKRGSEFYKQIEYKFNTTLTRDHCRGLYLFRSDDGVNFDSGKLILTVNHKGFNSSLDWKSSEFDCKPCIVKAGDEYFIYLRNNIDKDRRFIQYTKTKDFKHFEPFKNIDIEYNIESDNYYFCEVFYYNNMFFGFFPFYNNDKCCIKFAKSIDGHSWEIIKNLFTGRPAIIEGEKRKCTDHICSGVKEYNDHFSIFIHHNVLGYLDSDVRIIKYDINKEYLS